MKTKSIHNETVNIITMGCSKNLVDSENMLTQLKGGGIDVKHEAQIETDVVIINTCGFIENAKQESIDTILAYANAKDAGNVKKIYVTGCLSERYKENLIEEIPQVDAFFGTRELPALLKKFKIDYKHELVGERITTTLQHYAYMKIAEGCDRPCSFCAIPLMRGKHVSRTIEDLVKEAENLAKNDTKEIMLIAQDLTFYGLDIYKERKLADLLDKLAEVKGIEWIRLHYAYPAGFPMDIIDVMKKHDNICNYLDIPLQHGSSEMLKRMRRGIDRPKTEKLIADIRQVIPDIAIRTTLIVGHPGETDEEFEETCEFVRNMRFERLGVFTYSHEDNTHAYSMEDNVPEEVKEERAAQIMEIQQEIAFEKNQHFVEKTVKVLFDRKEGGYFIGRTEFDSPDVDNEVLVSAEDNYLSLGSFYDVKIHEAGDYDLYGKIVD